MQTASFNEQVDKHAQRGAGWALQREHAMPIVQCRHNLPAIVKALTVEQMSSNHISNYGTVLQWVGAHWNSLFLHPQELLFGGQDCILAVTPAHLQNMEARLLAIEIINRKLREPLMKLLDASSAAETTTHQQDRGAGSAHETPVLQPQTVLRAQPASQLACNDPDLNRQPGMQVVPNHDIQCVCFFFFFFFSNLTCVACG